MLLTSTVLWVRLLVSSRLLIVKLLGNQKLSDFERHGSRCLKASWCSRVNCTFFTNSASVAGHLYFQFLTSMRKDAMNIRVKVFVWIYFLILLGMCLEMEFLGPMVTVYLIISRMPDRFLKRIYQQCMRILISSHLCSFF